MGGSRLSPWLDAAQVRLDLQADGLALRVQHVAACPDVDPLLCETTEIPDHRHDQRVAWLRVSPTVNVGLGGGLQASLTAPLDLRVVRVEYLTLDDEPYEPPYDDIHHRDETLAGPVDATAWLRAYRDLGPWVLGAGLGVALPLGRTEEDPYALTEQGLKHQHMQLGTGTFVPQAGLEAVAGGRRWGAVGYATGRLPLYENGKGYRPPAALTAALGPTWRATPALSLIATSVFALEGEERWSGDPHGGRAALGASLGFTTALSRAWSVQAALQANAWERTLGAGEEESLRQPLIGTVGVSWTGD